MIMVRSRKRKAAIVESTNSGARTDITSVWKALIIFNILLSVFGFWMIYSQNNYILEAIQQHLPIAVPADYKGTSLVVNPFTGQFMAVNSITLAGTMIGILVLVGTYYLLKETL